MKIRKIIFLTFAMMSVSMLSYAQEDEFGEFYKQRTQEFKDWRHKANAEFSEYLAAAWQEFMIQRGREDPVGPVSDIPVYYDKNELRSLPHGLPSPGYGFASNFLEYPIVSEGDFDHDRKNVVLDFYGIKEEIPFSDNKCLPRIGATEQDASNGWKILSDSDFMMTIEAFLAMQRKYSLSDWALYSAVKKFTDAVYIAEYINEKILTQMFLLNQMQYRARVGSVGGELILLLPFTRPVYQVSYISDGSDELYIFSYSRISMQDPLYTFSDDFSAANRKLDLVIDKQMMVGKEFYRMKKMPEWSEAVGEDVMVPLNIPFIKFTLDYPQSDLSIYHRSDVDSKLKDVVFTFIKYKMIKDTMDTEESVSFVLRLIQRGFEYKTDYEMFGRAKPLFIEESFYYGANNCKDRVLLFSWIVEDLLGLDVVVFCYKGHVACGVMMPDSVAGDSFEYEGRRYVMCDPTYIGAPVGATMPKYRNVQPQIIRL